MSAFGPPGPSSDHRNSKRNSSKKQQKKVTTHSVRRARQLNGDKSRANFRFEFFDFLDLQIAPGRM